MTMNNDKHGQYRYADNEAVTDGEKAFAKQVKRLLVGEAEKCDIIVFDEIDSTNLYLKNAASFGAPDGTVAIANRQSAGRGRMGRHFVSDNGGLYMSLLVRADISAEQSLFITTSAAIAVCRAIESVSGQKAGIKWVNDVFIGDGKVCGILTEGAHDSAAGRLEYAVVGIGVNITEPIGGFAAEIADVAASVYGDSAPVDAKARMAAAILNELCELIAHGWNKTLAEEYRRRSVVIGKAVDIISEKEPTSATVVDIDDSAAVILRMNDGSIVRKTSGDIRLRVKK